ncbi:mannose-1-phosphate guanylyltransferase [Sediminitomix flava]|uniref:mannose-1-phosphate guanylyltransferase n=1 Tax=Sediminitomix flava TaxID=379075 RepID=A0A315Z0H3_SEDFL|nr:mannose-1-phosphate guanylyltransferase [Sediminitomix flava]PWJ36128.1 mannose-1-phosphate guanylyltransferase (GDP) [Sediminitomix flava]
MENNYVVIMAGGVGSRFWPFSRQNFPKQFQDILGTGRSMIQQTVDRFEGICPKENVYVVTNESYYDLIKEHLPFIADHQILLEPARKNTAPCIAYACYKIYADNPDANILVAPSDHVIMNMQEFQRVCKVVLDSAEHTDSLITLGIKPSRPDTGYGYIQAELDGSQGDLFKVKNFTEKPNLEKAEQFLASGDYLWNAGIFIWKAATIISQFEQHLPEVAALFQKVMPYYHTDEEAKYIHEIYPQCPDISIDYGIMEHAESVYVMPSDFGWSDLGTWKSLFELADKDEDTNVLQGDVVTYETKNSIIKTPKERLVIVQGLENYIVAEKDDVLIICQKDQEQRIKEFVKNISETRGDKYN